MTQLSRLKRAGLFDARVPRFTSFPPATWFSRDVDAETVLGWRGALSEGAELSLYVHVPFCRRLCWFCACRTQGTKTDAPLLSYVETLIAEARQVRAELPRAVRLRRLHLGGGTPTLLPVPLLMRLLKALDEVFGLGDLDEFSVEIDPTEVDRGRLEALRAFGFTRASLGVQDFDGDVQAAIGRAQSPDQTRAVVDDLRTLGVDDVNIDLLYGLPFQSRATLERTLDEVLALEPSRLALYGYAHVPWVSKRQVMIPQDRLPGPIERFGLSEHARKLLLGRGFRQIGIDHFARPDDGLTRALDERQLARSFQGYTDDRVGTLIGLGASAISRYPQGYAQNQPATAAYAAEVQKGVVPVARGYALSAEEQVLAKMVESLMCYFDVRLEELSGNAGFAGARLRDVVALYPDALEVSGDIWRVAPWARPMVRMLATALVAPDSSEIAEKKYSSAI